MSYVAEHKNQTNTDEITMMTRQQEISEMLKQKKTNS